MKEDSEDRSTKEKKNQKSNEVVEKFVETLKKKAGDIRSYLSERSLEELSQLTQLIGHEISAAFLSIGMIVETLRKRAKENNASIGVELDDRFVVVSPSMSDKDGENLANVIQNSVKEGSTVRFVKDIDSRPSKTNPSSKMELKKVKDDVQELQRKLDELKRM